VRQKLLPAVFCLLPLAAMAQRLPGPADSRHSMLREAMLGVLRAQPDMPQAGARRHCLELPALPDDRLFGPARRRAVEHALRGRQL
jgi:hypothetical protein